MHFLYILYLRNIFTDELNILLRLLAQFYGGYTYNLRESS